MRIKSLIFTTTRKGSRPNHEALMYSLKAVWVVSPPWIKTVQKSAYSKTEQLSQLTLLRGSRTAVLMIRAQQMTQLAYWYPQKQHVWYSNFRRFYPVPVCYTGAKSVRPKVQIQVLNASWCKHRSPMISRCFLLSRSLSTVEYVCCIDSSQEWCWASHVLLEQKEIFRIGRLTNW